MTQPPHGESLTDFRTSFSYGSRNDLNFKFLKSLPDEEAAEFFRVVLDRLGDAYDTGDLGPLIEAAIDAQITGYTPGPDTPPSPHTYGDGPFTPFDTPLSEARVGLLNSGGHFVEGDDPEPFGVPSMSQDEAIERIAEFLKDTPILSEIPSDLPPDRLVTRHGGYDITSAVRDRNVVFPVDRLDDARSDGVIAAVADTVFSFPGATAQGRLKRELPGWVDRIVEEEIDVLLLVPV